MECIRIPMGPCTRGVGWRTSRRDMESRLGQMEPSMKATTNRDKKKVLFKFSIMGLFMVINI